MDYLFSQFSRIKELLSDKFILLLLDYDGTLAPIARTPEMAVISNQTKEILRELSTNPHCAIGIISGRSLDDIKNIAGIENIIYAGNHGMEIEGPKIKFESRVSPRLKSAIQDIARDLKKRLSGIKGVLIENKGLTLSVHYRLVGKEDLPLLRKILYAVIRPYTASHKIKINSGKKVYEIKPPVEWDKGKVVLWLMARQQFASGEKKVLPVYIGDDASDEEAFKVIKRKGLTIFVGGPQDSKADFYLKNTQEVSRFLRLIFDLRHK